jgi:hypothetical protein
MLNDLPQMPQMPQPMNMPQQMQSPQMPQQMQQPTNVPQMPQMPQPMNMPQVQQPMPQPMNAPQAQQPMPQPMNVPQVQQPMPQPMNVPQVQQPMPQPMNAPQQMPQVQQPQQMAAPAPFATEAVPMPQLQELQQMIQVPVPDMTPPTATPSTPQNMPVARVEPIPASPDDCPFEIETTDALSAPIRFVANQFETLKTALTFMANYAADFRFTNGVSCFSTNANRFHVKVKLPFTFDFAIGEANTHIKMLSLLNGDVVFCMGGNLYFFRSATMLVSIGSLLGSPLGEIEQSAFDDAIAVQKSSSRILLPRMDVTELYTTASKVFKSVGGDAVIVRKKGRTLEFSVGYAQNMVRFEALRIADAFDGVEIDSGFPSELVSMGFDQVYATFYMTPNNEIFWHWECRMKDIEIELYTKTFRVPSSSL